MKSKTSFVTCIELRFKKITTPRSIVDKGAEICLSENDKIDPWLFPWHGTQVMTEFKQEAARTNQSSNNQDIQVLYLVKASGSGKTKIGFSLGLEDDFTVVTIRLATNDISPTVVFTTK